MQIRCFRNYVFKCGEDILALFGESEAEETVLPKPFAKCYIDGMEELEQLEISINALLKRLEGLEEDNRSLRLQFEALNEQISVLAGENQALLAAARDAEHLRSEVLRKIDDLLVKIVEHDSVG